MNTDTDEGSAAPELVDPPPAHRIDAGTLGTWLADPVPDANGLAARQFHGGMSNPTYPLTTSSGDRHIPRKKPSGALLPKAHQVDREHRVMQALADTPVPVPRMIALRDDPDVIGAEFFVMAFVDGRIIADPAMTQMDRTDRRPLFDSLIDTLAALHQIDRRAVDHRSSAGGYWVFPPALASTAGLSRTGRPAGSGPEEPEPAGRGRSAGPIPRADRAVRHCGLAGFSGLLVLPHCRDRSGHCRARGQRRCQPRQQTRPAPRRHGGANRP